MAAAKRRVDLEEAEKEDSLLNLSDEGLTEEDVAKRKAALDKKYADAAKLEHKAFVDAINKQEKQLESFRKDKLMIAQARERLMPGGVLIFVTPKELIDSQICHHLANSFEHIRIFRLEDEEYAEKRKVVIMAKKKAKTMRNQEYAFELILNRYKPYKEFPVLEIRTEPYFEMINGRDDSEEKRVFYDVPIKDPEEILNFRVGPITADEALSTMKKSPLIDNYIKNFDSVLYNEVPKPPTQLHTGHVALLLASGSLNGYIGEGPNRHLVKGSVHKQITERTEMDPETEEQKVIEREYFNIAVTYLNQNGEFKELM
jgi:hypothetical protein